MWTSESVIYVALSTLLIGSMLQMLWINHSLRKSSLVNFNGVKKASQHNPLSAPPRIATMYDDLPESVEFTLELRYAVVRPRNNSLTTEKRFVYLIEGPTKGIIEGLEETKERDVIWMTFADRSGEIYAPNTSVGSGRSALLQHAVNLAAQMKDGGYVYYIFMDDDLDLSLRSDGQVNWKPWPNMAANPFQRFEELLMHYQPAVGYVRYQDMVRQFVNKNQPVNLNWDFDECFNAFHRDTLSFLIPYDMHLDYESWFNGAWVTRQLISMLYHGYCLQCNSLHVSNRITQTTVSRSTGRYKAYFDYEIPRNYILSALLTEIKASPAEANPLIEAVLKGTSSRQSPGTLQPGPNVKIPGEPKRKGNHSYLVTPDFILKYWDNTHPMIQKKLTWLQKSEIWKILGLDNRRLQTFKPDTLYCVAPNEFSLSIGQ